MRLLDPAHALSFLLGVLALTPSSCSSDSPTPRDQTGGQGGDVAGGAGGSSSTGTGGESTDGGSGATGGSSMMGPDTLESVCRDALIAQCQRRVDCGMSSLQCFGFANLCPEYYFGPDSKRTLESVRACIPAIRQLSCSEITVNALPACLIGGARPTGMGCAYGSQCASASCDGGSSMCGKCSSVAPAGMPCSGGVECDVGSFCGMQSHICELNTSIVHGAEGAACNHSATPVLGCAGDLICFMGTCTKVIGQDQPCTGLGGVPCATGLVCVRSADGGGICQSLAACGTTTCDAGSYCKYNATPAACAPKAAEGHLCAMSGDTGQIPCIDGTTCTALTSGGPQGVCLKPESARTISCSDTMPCPYPMQCTSGKCSPLDPAGCGT